MLLEEAVIEGQGMTSLVLREKDAQDGENTC